MANRAVTNFMRQQGFPEEPADACDMRFEGLYFQPAIVFPLVLVAVALQSAPLFLLLSAVLWWNVVFPAWNPFERTYNRWIAAPRGKLPMGWVSHLECFWTEPSFARFLRRLARFSRLILFDKRGTGLSDRTCGLPSLEERMEDVRAVLSAVGSRRAALLGVSEGGPMCSLFAATHPDKTEALIMVGTYARRLWAPDYPWAPTQEEREAFCREILDHWGGPVGIEARAPSVAGDSAFREWWAAYLRMGASPAAAVALTRMNAEIDVRHVLPTVGVPTLVAYRADEHFSERTKLVGAAIAGSHEIP